MVINGLSGGAASKASTRVEKGVGDMMSELKADKNVTSTITRRTYLERL
jgi:hypothetical protein